MKRSTSGGLIVKIDPARVRASRALRAAAEAAAQGRDDTTPMQARKGRASYLGERSAGHQDPGATSSWMLVRAAADTLDAERQEP